MTSRQREGVDVYEGSVLAAWIDVNDHMNVAYYVLAFDLAVDSVWTQLGITSDYIAEQNNSTFAVESHITWQRELKLGEPFVVTSELLAYDAKRIHQFMRMYHAESGFLAATAEWMNLHVDMNLRRVSPWPEAILADIRNFVKQQGEAELPSEAGRRMKIESPHWTIRGYAP